MKNAQGSDLVDVGRGAQMSLLAVQWLDFNHNKQTCKMFPNNNQADATSGLHGKKHGQRISDSPVEFRFFWLVEFEGEPWGKERIDTQSLVGGV